MARELTRIVGFKTNLEAMEYKRKHHIKNASHGYSKKHKHFIEYYRRKK